MNFSSFISRWCFRFLFGAVCVVEFFPFCCCSCRSIQFDGMSEELFCRRCCCAAVVARLLVFNLAGSQYRIVSKMMKIGKKKKTECAVWGCRRGWRRVVEGWRGNWERNLDRMQTIIVSNRMGRKEQQQQLKHESFGNGRRWKCQRTAMMKNVFSATKYQHSGRGKEVLFLPQYRLETRRPFAGLLK